MRASQATHVRDQEGRGGLAGKYSSRFVGAGFAQGLASPCVLHHPERGIAVSVHGDDLTAVGPKLELDWSEEKLKARYELTVSGRIGPGPKDDKEATIPTRAWSWTPDGIEYEADPRRGKAT